MRRNTSSKLVGTALAKKRNAPLMKQLLRVNSWPASTRQKSAMESYSLVRVRTNLGLGFRSWLILMIRPVKSLFGYGFLETLHGINLYPRERKIRIPLRQPTSAWRSGRPRLTPRLKQPDDERPAL